MAVLFLGANCHNLITKLNHLIDIKSGGTKMQKHTTLVEATDKTMVASNKQTDSFNLDGLTMKLGKSWDPFSRFH